MESSFHSLENLFLQLGLDNSNASIDAFVQKNKLAHDEKLQDASFWTSAQSAFIQECLSEDSDWAEVVDQLNLMLHD
ncbi:DUF2789 domain-containing protein [Methylophaga thiooxydans]|uniref:DUF2789 domain-containing protein n=1 Tax=Methylophaga thiooxydans DMS010 TaxID=637616 RepID=C0N7P1_9GAMM|nr:DUF2789 domain-containing protein [Methylophaga thiooxydans]EEF79238.1 hypothetical protein MDMS009_1825 [Methylophaga thiooxydans DMS010]